MMTQQELLKYCFYYKGEGLAPPHFNKDEVNLWYAEKFVCEQMQNSINSKRPHFSMAEWVAAYLSKWIPFQFGRVITIYLDNAPSIKDEILAIYS